MNTDNQNLEKEVAEALDQDLAIRENELVEFNAEEKDALQAISASKSDATVLSEHHDNAYIQMHRGHLKKIANTIHYQMQKYAGALQDALIHIERMVIAAFIQSSQGYFDAEPTFKQLYIPQSGEIFGIFKQDTEGYMFETVMASVIAVNSIIISLELDLP